MKKITTLFTSLFVCAFMANAQQQTDITANHLQNADFEASPTFTESNGTPNGTMVTPGDKGTPQGYAIEGWNTTISLAYGRSATAKYGITFTEIPQALTAVNPPAADKNGNSDGHVLMLSAGWSSEVRLTQDVTLPAGSYELVFDVKNLAPGKNLAATYFGFIPNGGTPVYSAAANYTADWTEEKVAFSLTEQTTGKISLGLKALQDLSTNNSVLAIDHVKLLQNTVDKTKLNEAISSATWIRVPGCPGEAYLEEAIAAAQAVADKANATVEDILKAIAALEHAMEVYQDATLADLQVDGVTVAGFDPEVLAYTCVVAPDATPVVTAVAAGTAANAAVSISPINPANNTVTINVTSGKGDASITYTVTLNSDYMVGWDANGDVTKSPYDAGWRTTDANAIWNSVPGTAQLPEDCRYRDNLGVGRVFIHPKNDAVFSYPVANLKAGKMYTLTCSSAKMSGNTTRPTTFSINTAEDGTGTTLASISKDAAKWDNYTNYSLPFVIPTEGTYYVIWQTNSTDDGDRALAWGFKLIQTGEAIRVTFNSNGGTEVEPQYLAYGDKIVEPEEPVKDGFMFNGWWYDEDGFASKWNFELGVEKDMVLEARWIDPSSISSNATGNAFEVTMAQNGVNVKAGQPVEVRVISITGQNVKAMTVKAGETFISLPAGMYIINGIKAIVK